MRRASLALLVLTTACTTEPETSPGELTRVRDQAFACSDSPDDTTWACTIDLSLVGAELTTIGIHNDGSENGPRAVATLSETALADIAALVATMPTRQDSEGLRCGAVLSARNYTIDFDTVGVTDLSFHSVESGPARELENYVTGLITAIDTCQGNDRISFSSCSPRIMPAQ